jgi:hypothetical protein
VTQTANGIGAIVNCVVRRGDQRQSDALAAVERLLGGKNKIK